MTFKDDLENEIIENHLNIDEFGETVTYKPLDGPIFDIKVIFDDSYEGVDTESGNVINTKQPKVTARSADFETEPAQGDIIERLNEPPGTAKEYKVAQHLPDGAGISEILLHEVEET